MSEVCMFIMPSSTETSSINDAEADQATEAVGVTFTSENPASINMSSRLDEGCELQQLVCDEEEVRNGTPPVSPNVCKVTQTSPTNPNSNKPVVNRHDYTRIPTCDDDGIQVPTHAHGALVSQATSQTTSQGTSQGSLTSRSMNRVATAPALSAAASSAQNTRLLFVNEKLSRGPSLMAEHGGTRSARDRPEKSGQTAPRAQMKRGTTSIGLASSGSHSQLLQSRSRLHGLDSRAALRHRSRDSDRSCQHHCFLTDVTDVHRMEEALLHLLEDFHSGKLRAFGKDCSMEQMTGIREQQERLARLHFDLGAQGELFPPLSDEGLRAGQENMRSLMGSLQQLSVSIERLHSFSESREGSQQPE